MPSWFAASIAVSPWRVITKSMNSSEKTRTPDSSVSCVFSPSRSETAIHSRPGSSPEVRKGPTPSVRRSVVRSRSWRPRVASQATAAAPPSAAVPPSSRRRRRSSAGRAGPPGARRTTRALGSPGSVAASSGRTSMPRSEPSAGRSPAATAVVPGWASLDSASARSTPASPGASSALITTSPTCSPARQESPCEPAAAWRCSRLAAARPAAGASKTAATPSSPRGSAAPPAARSTSRAVRRGASIRSPGNPSPGWKTATSTALTSRAYREPGGPCMPAPVLAGSGAARQADEGTDGCSTGGHDRVPRPVTPSGRGDRMHDEGSLALDGTFASAPLPIGSRPRPPARASRRPEPPDPDGARWPSPFVGRAPEMATLRGALRRAERGSGSVVLVRGGPGSGKSRLLDEFARHAARDGAVVLQGSCHGTDAAPALWPWIQLLRGLGHGFPAAAAPELVAGARAPGAEPRFTTCAEVAQVLERAARLRPVIISIDDAEEGDPASLLLTTLVARTVG